MFCFHRWQVETYRHVDIYGDEFGNNTKLPVGSKTEISLTCSKCGKPKLRKLRGDWNPATQDEVGR